MDFKLASVLFSQMNAHCLDFVYSTSIKMNPIKHFDVHLETSVTNERVSQRFYIFYLQIQRAPDERIELFNFQNNTFFPGRVPHSGIESTGFLSSERVAQNTSLEFVCPLRWLFGQPKVYQKLIRKNPDFCDISRFVGYNS